MDAYDALEVGFGAASAIWSIAGFIISILSLVAMWKIFAKAGKPGWASLIPIYNAFSLFDIAFGSGWMFLLMLIPGVNGIVAIILLFKLAKAFGKGVGFGFGLLFFNPIFMLILGFGSAEYQR